jgi:hypothetical protein
MQPGLLNDLIKTNVQSAAPFLGKLLIPKGATSKARNESKREMVIALEMNFMAERVDMSKLPLATDVVWK